MCSFAKQKKIKREEPYYELSGRHVVKIYTDVTQLLLSQRKPAVDGHVKTQVWACGALAQLQTERIKLVGQLAGL